MAKIININDIPLLEKLNQNDLVLVTINNISKQLKISELSNFLTNKQLKENINTTIQTIDDLNNNLFQLSTNEYKLSNNVLNIKNEVDDINPNNLLTKYQNFESSLSTISTEIYSILSDINTLNTWNKNLLQSFDNFQLSDFEYIKNNIHNISVDIINLSVEINNTSVDFNGGLKYKVDIKTKPPLTSVISSTITNIDKSKLYNQETKMNFLQTNYEKLSIYYETFENISNELTNNLKQRTYNIIFDTISSTLSNL